MAKHLRLPPPGPCPMLPRQRSGADLGRLRASPGDAGGGSEGERGTHGLWTLLAAAHGRAFRGDGWASACRSPFRASSGPGRCRGRHRTGERRDLRLARADDRLRLLGGRPAVRRAARPDRGRGECHRHRLAADRPAARGRSGPDATPVSRLYRRPPRRLSRAAGRGGVPGTLRRGIRAPVPDLGRGRGPDGTRGLHPDRPRCCCCLR